MLWDILDMILNLFYLFPNKRKEEDDATKHFKK